MGSLTKEDVHEAIKEAFADPNIVSPATHERHHRQYAQDLEDRAIRKRNRQRIFNTVIGGLILSFIGVVFVILKYGAQVIVTTGIQP